VLVVRVVDIEKKKKKRNTAPLRSKHEWLCEFKWRLGLCYLVDVPRRLRLAIVAACKAKHIKVKKRNTVILR
jgi:hypothetical protein